MTIIDSGSSSEERSPACRGTKSCGRLVSRPTLRGQSANVSSLVANSEVCIQLGSSCTALSQVSTKDLPVRCSSWPAAISNAPAKRAEADLAVVARHGRHHRLYKGGAWLQETMACVSQPCARNAPG